MFSCPPVCRPIRISEICDVLGYYAAYSRDSYQTFRDNLSLPSSRVKKSFCLYSSWISSSLKMRPKRPTERSVRNYRPTRGTVIEESRSRLFRGESRKSRRTICICIWTVVSTIRFETLIAADVHVRVFWTVMTCSLVHRRIYQRCLRLQGTVKLTL